MEDSFANQPKEAVNTGPELTDITKRLCAVAKQINTVNTVAEAQNQAAGDDGGNQRGKDFSQHAHNSLQCVLILLGRALDGVFGNTINAGYRDKIIVKIVDRVADNHLKLPGLCECTFGRFQRLDFGNICLGRVIQHKAHTRYAVRYRRNVFFAAHIFEKQLCIFLIFTHDVLLLYLDFSIGCSACSNKLILQLQYS